jgi:hypothetical protein
MTSQIVSTSTHRSISQDDEDRNAESRQKQLHRSESPFFTPRQHISPISTRSRDTNQNDPKMHIIQS